MKVSKPVERERGRESGGWGVHRCSSCNPGPCVLTDAGCSSEPGRHVRGLTRGKERLHQVVGERDGDDSLAGGLNDQQRSPQANEGNEATE